jgi:putative ABC transport system ATP-binding protein
LHNHGSTIMMVTHEDEIAAHAQRVIRFMDGRVERDELNGKMPVFVTKEDEHAII